MIARSRTGHGRTTSSIAVLSAVGNAEAATLKKTFAGAGAHAAAEPNSSAPYITHRLIGANPYRLLPPRLFFQLHPPFRLIHVLRNENWRSGPQPSGDHQSQSKLLKHPLGSSPRPRLSLGRVKARSSRAHRTQWLTLR